MALGGNSEDRFMSSREIHPLGAAEGRKGDWRPLSESVTDSVYNYFSTNDAVLKFAFAAAQAGIVAVGLRGFGSKLALSPLQKVFGLGGQPLGE